MYRISNPWERWPRVVVVVLAVLFVAGWVAFLLGNSDWGTFFLTASVFGMFPFAPNGDGAMGGGGGSGVTGGDGGGHGGGGC